MSLTPEQERLFGKLCMPKMDWEKYLRLRDQALNKFYPGHKQAEIELDRMWNKYFYGYNKK